MLSSIIVGITIIFIVLHLIYFITKKDYKKSYINIALFYKIFFIFLSVTVGFAILYHILAMEQVILRMNSGSMKPADDSFLTHLYFSGVTILSVGYGDLVPVGAARFFALIESSIGIILPTAYFIRTLGNSERSQQEE